MQLKPIKKSRLYESAVDQIRSLILADNYKPGDRLPSERYLAEQLSIGRPSVREALRILGAMGLIEIRVGSGTYVRDVTLLPYIESLIALISSRLKSQEEDILKLWEVRKILEAGNVGLACPRMTPRHLGKMEECVREMEKNLENREAFIPTGVQFHREIAEATENEILIMLWNHVWDLILQSDLYRRRSSPQFSQVPFPSGIPGRSQKDMSGSGSKGFGGVSKGHGRPFGERRNRLPGGFENQGQESKVSGTKGFRALSERACPENLTGRSSRNQKGLVWCS